MMGKLGILPAILQKIPPEIRRWMLIVYALVVAAVGVLRLFNVDLDYDTIDAWLVGIGAYLGLQSAANVPTAPEPTAPPPEPEVTYG
jgi:hypothetical protein